MKTHLSNISIEAALFLLFNVTCIGLLFVALIEGTLTKIDEGDSSHIVYILAATFAVGLFVSFYHFFKKRKTVFEETFIREITGIRFMGNLLVMGGLIGTVIGFIFAFQGVSVEAASDPKAIVLMISTLINGLSVALYTTLVGSILNIWLLVNARLLESRASKVLENDS